MADHDAALVSAEARADVQRTQAEAWARVQVVRAWQGFVVDVLALIVVTVLWSLGKLDAIAGAALIGTLIGGRAAARQAQASGAASGPAAAGTFVSVALAGIGALRYLGGRHT